MSVRVESPPLPAMPAESILIAITTGNPSGLALGASTVPGRKASGDVVALTGSDLITITGAALDSAVVHNSLYDANTILMATTDNTPVALTVGASTIVGRAAAGNIVALTGSQVITITGAALDSAVVHNTGTENVGGAKTFTTGLIASGGGFRVDSSGRIGVGNAQNTTVLAYIGDGGTAHPGSGTTLYGVFAGQLFPATTTSAGVAMYVSVATAASSFTMTQSVGLWIAAPSLGASSAITSSQGILIINQGNASVTNAYGININAQTASATLNVGVRIDASTTCALWLGGSTTSTTVAGGIAFGSGRDVTLYRAGAALLQTNSALTVDGALIASTSLVVSAGSFRVDSSGRVALDGSAINADMMILVSNAALHPSSATTVYGVYNRMRVPTTATVGGWYFYSKLDTAASAAITQTGSIWIDVPAVGASSTITASYGILVNNQGATGITTSYGLTITAQSGSGTASYGARIDTATTAAVWIGADTTSTTVAGGIAFGSGKDVTLFRGGSGVLATNSIIKYTTAGNCTTGAGTALLGANCPALTVSAPYKWLTFQTDDGSTVYVPAWK